MHQLIVRSMSQEIDARIDTLERDGIRPLYILIGKTSCGYLAAELRNKTKDKNPPRVYRDCLIVLDPWRHYYLGVLGDIIEQEENNPCVESNTRRAARPRGTRTTSSKNTAASATSSWTTATSRSSKANHATMEKLQQMKDPGLREV